jgi:large subunit ribosomal protein L25
MSEDVLNVAVRTTRGSRAARRMRDAGSVPAVLYGHGEGSVSLTLRIDQIEAALRHGSRVVNLQGELSENALIKDIQWDAFGSQVLHVDLTRVSATERIESKVLVELRGEAPGTKQGGVVEQPCHEVDVEFDMSNITDRLSLTINDLELDQTLTAADLELPAGAKLLTEPETVLVQCVLPQEMPEEAALAEGVEPEVIGRKEEEGEED